MANFMLDMPVLKGAKICGSECVYRHGDGSIDALKSGIVSCVGCGRQCHMQCHKVTGDIFETVKATPKNNRCNVPFGEASNVRIVCDNCLSWLSCEVPTDTKASFMLVFSRIAAKLISEKYADAPKNRETPNARKRRLTDSGEALNIDAATEIRDALAKCLNTIVEMEKKNDSSAMDITSRFDKLQAHITNTVKTEIGTVKDCVQSKCDVFVDFGEKLKSNSDKIDNLACKIDEKIGLDATVIDAGNANASLYAYASTPIRSSGRAPRSPGSTIRRRAMINNARSLLVSGNNETPRTALFRNHSSPLPTQSGTSSIDDIFGPTVQRNSDVRGSSANAAEGEVARAGSQFKQKRAIYVRYVSAAITPRKMKLILQRDARVAECIDQNEHNVEITRLVKKNVSEDIIARRRNGISYRIGCPDGIFPIISDPGFWASHWEIRPWNDEPQTERSTSAKNETHQYFNHPPNVPQAMSTDQVETI